MKYHPISGEMCMHMTGLERNCDERMKSGFDVFVHGSTPIDAIDVIPAGSVHCIEWDSTFDKGSKSWFASQRISLRVRQ